MGKNYAESSLKHYLKQKVRITLGLVVTFLITGAVAFAEGTAEKSEIVVKLEEQQENYNTAKENLKLGQQIENKIEKTKVTIEYNADKGKNEIKFNNIAGVNNIEIDKSILSTTVKEKLNNITNDYYSSAQTIAENNGVIAYSGSGSNAVQATSSDVKNIINNGIIVGRQELNIEKGNAENNGVIIFSRGDNGGQKISSNAFESNISNKGIIISNQSAGQVVEGNKSKAFNYGVIEAKNGQHIGEYSKVEDVEAYNYGLINTTGYGQKITKGNNSNIYNYGIINGKGEAVGQYVASGNSYNYGLITVENGFAMTNGKINNYGVIKSTGNSSIFRNEDKDIVSKGIVIGENINSEAEYFRTSAVFDKNYNIINKDYIHEIKENKVNGADLEKDIAVIKNGNTEISGIFEDKVMASVVTDKTTDPVFNLGKEETILKDTNLVGYFENENGGTLVKVEAGETLTLDGKTNITAVTDDIAKEVNAVEVESGSILNIVGNDIRINGIIKGMKDADINAYALGGSMEVSGGNVTISNILDKDIKSEYLKENNFINKAELNGNMNNLTFNFSNTTIDKETGESKLNEVIIKDGTTINAGGKFKDETEAGNKSQVTIENVNKFTENLTDFTFGAGDNTVIVDNNKEFAKLTDLGAGEDTFTVKYGETALHTDEETGKEIGYSVFDYKVANAETIELSGKGQWTIGENANISFDHTGEKAGHQAMLKATDGAILNIIMNEGGSNLNNMIKDGGLLEKGDHLVLGTDENSLIKYQIGASGLPFTQEDTSYTADYGIAENTNVIAPIFNVTSDGKTTSISLKTAEQAGVGNYAPIYNAYIKQVANKNWDVIKYINSLNSDEALVEKIIDTEINAEAYYTAGTIVTKNITDSYLSAVEDFKERAGKGEWLAQGKYINSDTEFDGGSKVKGYDGDINSAVGMVEYGFTENTSYGVAFGGGDTTVDIDGGGKLDGDNYYLGFYTKHRTANGIDLVGNFGIMKSDLDSSLGNEFAFTVNSSEISDKTFEKGTADSTAFALSLKGKKDFYVTDSVKLQPVLGARMTLINQDKAENPAMNFEIKEQDVFIAEGILGVNVAKEFALSNGKVELNTGVEYAFAASTENDDAEYRLFSNDDIKIENSKIASSKGTFHIGADYEYESGIGFNGKYEMLWSDKGDDSRITAGVSYRF